jgi:hypothetical protein
MDKIITQKLIENKTVLDRIGNFFKRFKVTSLVGNVCNHNYKSVDIFEVFLFLFKLVFTHRSFYSEVKNNECEYSKDKVYRFLDSTHINWLKFTTMLSSNIINSSIALLTSENREKVFIFDDSVFSRNRSNKVELLTRIYDHAHKTYLKGFRMLTLGWSDGNTFMPVNSVLLSSENKDTVINPSRITDKRTNAFKLRKLSQTKATEVMLHLLDEAKSAGIKAKYVLFDSWFTYPSTIMDIKDRGYDVISMVKRMPNIRFEYNGEMLTLKEIFSKNKKKRGRSHYLLSVEVNVLHDGKSVPAKIVYVRNRSNRKDYLCLISTDTSLSEDEIIRVYGKRWSIEVFFKICKSYLKLSKECRSISFDAMTAHTAVVFARYMMLALEKRESEDPRSLGELFACCTEELKDISVIEAFAILVDSIQETFEEHFDIKEEELNRIIEKFLSKLPENLKSTLGLLAA